ncbi:MAG: Xylanase [Verrucomicrobiales bacterium]|nr:Xylanase [Verrucomicrobiales bacterium]
MKALVLCPVILVCLLLALPTHALAAESFKVINLWPVLAPGEKESPNEERNITTPTGRPVAGKPVIRIGHISKPTITVYRPPSDKNSGTAVLVCPGGGYNIVAADLEGQEVCAWLNSIGVTGVLLKYRVPRHEGLEKHTAPFQDAQRAMGLIRQHASEWDVNPKRIGIMGFSAGGHLAATLSTSTAERTYPTVDAADAVNCHPNFALLVYPAYLTPTNDLTKLSSEFKVTTNHPPTFMAMAQDDPVHVENVLLYSLALKQAKVPFELHVYPTGGHGYGLRKTEKAVTTWNDRATEWLRSLGLLSQHGAR